MELRSKYHQTEADPIPADLHTVITNPQRFNKDWGIKRLGDFADCVAGGTPKTFNKEYWGGSIRWMSSSELNNKVIQDVEKRITERGLRESSTKIIPPRCVLIGLAGQGKTRGTVAINVVEICTNQSIAAILPNKSFVPEYLYYNLDIRYNELRALSTGDGGRGGLNLQIIRSIEVPFPEIAEQTAIAEVLSDVDGLLIALDTLITKKRAIMRATMQQLLTGKTRLPGFSGDWKEKRLGELGDFSGGGVDKKIRINEVPVRLVNYLDVYKKRFLNSSDLTHEVSAKPEHAQHCLVKKGDIFFTPTSEVRGDIGRSAVAMEDIADGVYSYHVVRFRLKPNWDLGFRGYAFDTKRFFDQATTQCAGSGTRYVITLSKFRSMVVHFPPSTEEQQAIASVLFDIDAEISALEQRRDKTAAIKKGITQALLTGRIRLIEPNTTTEGLTC